MDRRFRKIDKRYQKNRKKRKAIMIVAFFVCLFAGTGLFYRVIYQGDYAIETDSLSHPKVNDPRSKEEARVDFDELSAEIFKEEVCDNSIILNYTIKDISNYDLEKIEPCLGNYSLEEMQSDILASENRIALLETFDYSKLTEEQQLIYDILYHTYKQNLSAADYLEYQEVLSPMTGIQAQLPIYFAEYNLRNKEDVETYIQLLNQVPEYFRQMVAFEKIKSEKGLFMSDDTADAIIEQCKEFIKTPENNYLIGIFAKRLQKVEGLSKEELSSFESANKKAVLESVVPAYQILIDGLTELKGTGTNDSGLCHFKNGKKYYTYLLQTTTGLDDSPEDMIKLLDTKIKEYSKSMADIMAKDSKVYDKAKNVSYTYQKPDQILEHIKTEMANDFTPLEKEISYEIKDVDKSLEDHLSQAFYLVPAIDGYQENSIYINKDSHYDQSRIFTTMGHEGYPGHLYQNCYFLSQNPAPVRSVISVGGYTEGWGTYAEIYSYDYAGLEKNVAELLKVNTLLTLCLYAKADIMVNYSGWSQKELANYLEDYGFSKTNSKKIFDIMVQEPCEYPKYTMGYLEIMGLREKAEKELGEKFTLRAYHDFFLSIGQAPFIVVEDRFNDWIKEQKRK